MEASDAKQLRNVLARNVRQRRREKGLSQEALAAAAGLHRTYVGSIERSERNVSLDSLCALASGLSVAVWSLLFTGEEQPPRAASNRKAQLLGSVGVGEVAQNPPADPKEDHTET